VIDKWLEFIEGPIPKSLINEIDDVDFVVDFEVAPRPLTATERAQRRWFKREKDHEQG
jgi:hypothetical protein